MKPHEHQAESCKMWLVNQQAIHSKVILPNLCGYTVSDPCEGIAACLAIWSLMSIKLTVAMSLVRQQAIHCKLILPDLFGFQSVIHLRIYSLQHLHACNTKQWEQDTLHSSCEEKYDDSHPTEDMTAADTIEKNVNCLWKNTPEGKDRRGTAGEDTSPQQEHTGLWSQNGQKHQRPTGRTVSPTRGSQRHEKE